MSKFSVFKKKSRKFSTRQVFNAPLSPLLPIHPFIQRCIDFIKECGLDQLGIFRKSPSPIVVKKIIKDLNKGISVDIHEYDVHTAASLIKQYLRDLPEPLLTNNLFQDFITLLDIKESQQQSEKLISLLQLIPVANQILLLTLLDLFSDINDHQENNKMNYDNMSIFFGPSILYISQEEFKTLQVLTINKKLIGLGLIILNNSKEISKSITSGQQNELPFNQSINFILKNFTYKIIDEEMEYLNNYHNQDNNININKNHNCEHKNQNINTEKNQNKTNVNEKDNEKENSKSTEKNNPNNNNSNDNSYNSSISNDNNNYNIVNTNELNDINSKIKQLQSSSKTNYNELSHVLKYLYKELCCYKLQNYEIQKQLKEIVIDLKRDVESASSSVELTQIDLQKKIKTRQEFEEEFDNFTNQLVEQQSKFEIQHRLTEKQQKEIDDIQIKILNIENELEKETNQGEELILKLKNEIKKIETEKISLMETSKLLESERDELTITYTHLLEKEEKTKKKLNKTKNQLILINQYLKKTKIELVLTEKKINFIKDQFLELIEILKLEKIFYQKKKIENIKKSQQLEEEINKQKKKHQESLISKKKSQINFLSIQTNVIKLQKQLDVNNNKFQNQEQEIYLLEKHLKKLRNKKK
ncbi:rho/rac/cdc gtpase-activating protein [Anaeramoeba flamelloides]|uniref:Rho/rac/cdc gtpase-activating protein n=1 Tax=Anaeramoeba flamelloides TaxID=1746091 RepID=A0ABQ8X2A4_9EUKA|nr:rho/rac/cdc gtpase-activating protein [Anaeramoeba flamelloides]